jgi:hypothetical protein
MQTAVAAAAIATALAGWLMVVAGLGKSHLELRPRKPRRPRAIAGLIRRAVARHR